MIVEIVTSCVCVCGDELQRDRRGCAVGTTRLGRSRSRPSPRVDYFERALAVARLLFARVCVLF